MHPESDIQASISDSGCKGTHKKVQYKRTINKKKYKYMKEKRSMFTNNEIPLKDFEKAGLDIGKMPADMLSSLMKGEISQVMEIRPVLKSGRKEALPVKLRLTRDEDNRVVLMAYPVHRDIVNNLRLGEQEQQRLRQGETIRKEVRDGQYSRQMFIQLDKDTRCLMMRDERTIELNKRMDELEHVKDITLGQNQRQAIREGKPIELEVGDTKVTVGVDLSQNSGFKAIEGDMQEWKRKQQIAWDIANPGAVGFWQTEENRWEYKQTLDKYKYKDERSPEKKDEHKSERKIRP